MKRLMTRSKSKKVPFFRGASGASLLSQNSNVGMSFQLQSPVWGSEACHFSHRSKP